MVAVCNREHHVSWSCITSCVFWGVLNVRNRKGNYLEELFVFINFFNFLIITSYFDGINTLQ